MIKRFRIDSLDGQIANTQEAAAILGIGTGMVRKLAEQGRLRCARTAGGYRIYLRAEVEELAAERAKPKK